MHVCRSFAFHFPIMVILIFAFLTSACRAAEREAQSQRIHSTLDQLRTAMHARADNSNTRRSPSPSPTVERRGDGGFRYNPVPVAEPTAPEPSAPAPSAPEPSAPPAYNDVIQNEGTYRRPEGAGASAPPSYDALRENTV